MANKYDVRKQIEAEKTQSEFNKINTYANLINSALSFGETIYNQIEKENEIAKQQQEELDTQAGKQYFYDNVYSKQNDVDNELSYNKIETKPATMLDNAQVQIKGQGISQNSGAISTDIITQDAEYTYEAKTPDEKYQALTEYYTNFKANHKEDFDNASESFKKAFDDCFNSFWADKQLSLSQERITNNDVALKGKVDNNAQLAIDNAGTNVDYYESQLAIKYGGDLSKAHYEINDLPDVSDENYAKAKLERDFNIIKSYVYEEKTSYRGYTPELAEEYINQQSVQIAMNMDYNSAKEEIAELIRTDPTFNYSLYAQAKTESFISSELIKANGLQDKITASDVLTYESNMSTIAKREVALFQQQIQTSSNKLFTSFSDSINDTENPLTTKTVYDAVDSLAVELGINGDKSRELLYANMDDDTRSAFDTFLYIGQENEYKIEASRITEIIDDDAKAVEYAEENGIDYTSIEDLRYQIKTAQSAGVQNYIYVPKFTSDYKVVLSSTDSSTGSTTSRTTTPTISATTTTISTTTPAVETSSTGSTTSGSKSLKTPTLVPTTQDRIDEFNETHGIQDQAQLSANDTYTGYVQQYSSRQEQLDKYNLMQDALSRIDSWIADGDTGFKELIQAGLALDEGVANDENDKAKESGTESSQSILGSNAFYLPVSEIVKPLAKIAKEIGIDDITQMDTEQVKVLSEYIDSLKTNLAKSMTTDTEYFKSVGVMEKKLSEDEILNESTQRILGEKYSNSYIGNIRKNYEINKANTTIYEGSNSLVTQYSVLGALEALKLAVDDGLYDSAEIQEIIKELLAENEDVANIIANAYDVASWADSNIDLSSSRDIQRVIDNLNSSIDLTASTMSKASSKKTKYGSSDTEYSAEEFKKLAQQNEQVKNSRAVYSTTEEQLKNAIDNYMKNAMLYREDSINRYEITGEKDEIFEQYRTYLTTKDANGNDVVPSDSSVIAYMKELQSKAKRTYMDVNPESNGTVVANLAIYKEQARLAVRDKYLAVYSYTDELDISNIIDCEAIDNLYAKTGKTGAKTYAEKLKAIKETELKKTETPVAVDMDLLPVRAEQTESVTKDSNTILSKIQKEKEKIKSRYETELIVQKEKDSTLYADGEKLATDWIADNQNLIAQLTTEVQNSAWLLLSTGKTNTEVSSIIQSVYGVSKSDADSFVKGANALSYDNTNNVFHVDTKAFNMAFNGEDVSGLINEMIDSYCSTLNPASRAIASRKYASTLMEVIRKESTKGQSANYQNALANYEAQMKKTTNKTMKEMFGVSSVSNYTTADGKKEAKAKEADYGDCEWGHKYNEGQLYFTTYTSMINDSQFSKYESNIQVLNTLSNDTTINKEVRTKTCTALAINTLYGTEVITAEDVANMSAEEMWQQAINLAGNSFQLNQISVLGDIYYTGSVGLQCLVQYGKDAWWLDSNFSDASIIYTDAGYIYKCQNINGETVYAKPTFNGESASTFTFYKDKNCTQAMYNPLGEALKGMSNASLDSLNVDTVLQGYRNTENGVELADNLLHLDLETREQDTPDIIEQKTELRNMRVAYEDSTGQTKYASLGQVQQMNNAVGGIKIVDSTYTHQATYTTKRALSMNYQIASSQKATGSAPTGLTSLIISDGSFELKSSVSYGAKDITSVNGQLYIKDSTNQKTYSIGTDGKITPELINKISNEAQKEYYKMAQEIVTRSSGQVAIADAYEAISMAMEGYDQCVTVLGYNNKVYTYIPKIQQYIVAGWYL